MKEITLPSGRKAKVHVGLRARIAAANVGRGEKPMREADEERLEADPVLVADRTIAYVCAATVEPKLTALNPAPEGYTHVDNLADGDFEALCEALGELRTESEGNVSPFSKAETS